MSLFGLTKTQALKLVSKKVSDPKLIEVAIPTTPTLQTINIPFTEYESFTVRREDIILAINGIEYTNGDGIIINSIIQAGFLFWTIDLGTPINTNEINTIGIKYVN